MEYDNTNTGVLFKNESDNGKSARLQRQSERERAGGRAGRVD